MRLVAIYIEDQYHDNGGYIINLGGNYSYDLKFGSGYTDIIRYKNENYIEDFFDSTNTVTNVSAIVGSNGSGKTTTIHKLIDLLNQNFTSGFTFWEDGEDFFIDTNNLNIPPIKFTGEWSNRIKTIQKQVGTIYYSPYLDHKKQVIGADLSADYFLNSDLANLDSTFDANSKVIINERLKRSDYNRFINFQKSDFSEIISKKYGLLNDDKYRVVFTRHRINAKTSGLELDNTPTDFRYFLNQLFLQIREEYDQLNRYVKSPEDRFELNKAQFKNILLMDIFCLLIKLMERHNTFLNEGHFSNIEEQEEFTKTNPNAFSKLKYWLNNYYYSKWDKNPLPSKEVIEILDFLFDYIDNLSFFETNNLFDWRSKSLLFDETNLNKLLDLNESLMIGLSKYYFQKNAKDKYEFLSIGDLQQFANPEFSERRLSSGETALLKLYSRIFDYFSKNIINYNVIRKEDYYILFLDEADMGFHPLWKRSFIKSIIDFSKDFFGKLDSKVQIIFTTHDPLTLSDIPDTNITYLQSGNVGEIMRQSDPSRPNTSFGANINDLLGHSFFLEDLLIGDFAKSKINYVINWINEKKDKKRDFSQQEFNKIKKTISLIEEPVLRNKLAEMLGNIERDEDFVQKIIKQQSDYLDKILKNNRL